MIPIRCYTCNRPLAQHWNAFNSRCSNAQTVRGVLDAEGIVRMCCRTAFITHANPTRDYLPYSNDDVVLDGVGTTLQRRVRHERVVPCAELPGVLRARRHSGEPNATRPGDAGAHSPCIGDGTDASQHSDARAPQAHV